MAVIDEGKMHVLVLPLYKSTSSARLPVHLVVAMLGVARSTLYSWYAGVPPATKYHGRIKVLTAISELAVSSKMLPTRPSAVDKVWQEAITRYNSSSAKDRA
jgi:hypothetical protein